MKKRLFVVTVLLTAVVMVSCLEELEKRDKISSSSFKPTVEFPIVYSDFSMEEFLTEGESKARISEQNGVLVLTYDDSLLTPPADKFFVLANQQSPILSITGPEVTFPSPGQSVTITKNLTFSFNTLPGQKLDSILMKAGQMAFDINSNFPTNINLTVGIPSVKTQGNGFQQNFIFNAPGTQNPTINLQGTVLDLTGNGTVTNTISFSITATISYTSQPINSTHSLNFSFGLAGLKFRGLFGDMGSQAFQLNADSINVDIFDNAFKGSFELLSPAIRLNIKNSFGIPLGFNIQNIAAIKNTTVIPLTGPAVSAPLNPYRLGAPTTGQVGQTVNSVIDINSTNSNLSALISSLPNILAYKFDVALNPPPVTSKNFVMDDSRLVIGVHLELPLHGRVQQLSLAKRFEFDGFGIDDVEDTKVKIKTVNEAPLDAYVQVYFTDGLGNVIDSLFTDPSLLKAAPVGPDGFTTGSSEVVNIVDITQDKLDRIDQASYLVVAPVIYTTNNGTVPVKFGVTDRLKINIGLITRVGVEIP